MKLQIDGGLFTTSGYSSAGRNFANALIKNGVEVKVRDIQIRGDVPIKWKDPLMEHTGLLDDPDRVLMWGVPPLRSQYNKPFPDDVIKEHFFSWELNRIPELWKYFLNDVDTIYTPSRFSKNAIKKSRSDKRVELLPHGYDPEQYFHYENEEVDSSIFRVLYVGTWIKRKAPLETIISLMLGLRGTKSEILIKTNYDVQTLNRIKNTLQSQIMKVPNIPTDLPKIKFINGMATEREMNDLYNLADVVVLTSRGEAWGLPLMNAMATKTPIITTNKGGQMDFVPKDYEYLIDVVGTELASGEGYYSQQYGLKWHQPEFNQIQEKIRKLWDNHHELYEIGSTLYDAIEEMTWDWVAEKYINL